MVDWDLAGAIAALAVLWLLAPATVPLALVAHLFGFEDMKGRRMILERFEVYAMIGMLSLWLAVAFAVWPELVGVFFGSGDPSPDPTIRFFIDPAEILYNVAKISWESIWESISTVPRMEKSAFFAIVGVFLFVRAAILVRTGGGL